MLLVLAVFLLLCPYNSISVANLNYFETLSHVSVTSSIKRAADGTSQLAKHILFHVFDRQFDLTVIPGTHLMAKGFRANIINEDGSSSTFPFDRNQIFSGHMSDRPDVRVHAHKEETLWSVQIYDRDNIYIVEPAWRLLKPADNPRNDTLIAYRASDLKSDSFNSSKLCGTKSPKKSERYQHLLARNHGFKLHKQGKNCTRGKRSLKGSVCVLYLVGDYTFFKGVCRGSYASCVNLMFASVNYLDDIFTTSKFVDEENETHKGIGLQVGEVTVYKTYTEPNLSWKIPHFNENRAWRSNQRLESFAYGVDSLTAKKRFCAHHLFTDYPYPEQILGVAFIGGLCHSVNVKYKGNKGSLMQNSAISSATDILAGPFSTLQMNLVFAHEMGHLFGAGHDPNTEECSKTERFGDTFLMYTYSLTGKYPNNAKFSPCSLKEIGQKLFRYSCLVPRSNAPFCGNGAVETGEYCDAGSHGMVDLDPCCDKDCKLRDNATCSDANNLCCKTCSLAPAHTPCLYREPVDCTEPSFCTGHSYSCPRPQMLSDGTNCPGPGQCYDGKCLNFCSKLSRNRTVRLQACMCRTNDNGAACKFCCFETENINVSDWCRVYSNESVPDGTQCYMGYCKSGVCESREMSSMKRFQTFLTQIRTPKFETFVKSNLVLFFIMMSLILWMPAAVFIYRKDTSAKKMRKAKAASERRKRRRERETGSRSSLQSTNVSFFLTPKAMGENKSVSLATDIYSKRLRGVSGSFFSFLSEAGRIFTGRTADIHVAAVNAEARLEGQTVGGKGGIKVVRKDSAAEDQSQSDLMRKRFSDLADTPHSDVGSTALSDPADKILYDLRSASHSDVGSLPRSDVGSLPRSDLANTKLYDLWSASHSDVGSTPRSHLADTLPSNLANKEKRVSVHKWRYDEMDSTQSDVTGSSQAGSGTQNTK